MSCLGTAVIVVVVLQNSMDLLKGVLQNSMDLLKGEVGSSSETCVTSGLDINEITGVINEQCTFVFESGNQSLTDATSFQMLTSSALQLQICATQTLISILP